MLQKFLLCMCLPLCIQEYRGEYRGLEEREEHKGEEQQELKDDNPTKKRKVFLHS